MATKKLVLIENDQAITTSLKVAEIFDKRHDLVLRDIRNLIDDLGGLRKIEESAMFVESTYTNKQNKQQPMYLMNRRGFSHLAFSFNGKKAALLRDNTAELIKQFRLEKLQEEGKA